MEISVLLGVSPMSTHRGRSSSFRKYFISLPVFEDRDHVWIKESHLDEGAHWPLPCELALLFNINLLEKIADCPMNYTIPFIAALSQTGSKFGN
jgi:hypothetical protein